MSDLAAGLAASANEPVADSPATIDEVLDTAFDAPSEPAAGSEPSGTPESVPEPAAATVQPQTPADPNGAKGEPPRERWDTILANARTKAREDALAEHRDHLEIVQRLKADLPGTLAQLLEESAGDPRFSEQITAKAAAILSARKQAAKQDERPEPDMGDDKYAWYSPEQQQRLEEWRARQIEARLDEKYKPLKQLQQRFEEHQQVQHLAQQAASVAEERGALWKGMPHFAEHKADILKRQSEIYAEVEAAAQRGERRMDPVNAPWEALQRAYAEVVSTQALPKLQSQHAETLVAQAARKRAGSSSDPAAMAPAQPRKPRTVDEALEQAFSGLGL